VVLREACATRVVVCALVAAGAALGAAAQAAAPNGRIGFLRPLGGNEPPYEHLFVVNLEGSRPVDLTPAGYADIRSFAWSPSGTRIASSAIQAGDSDPELFVMNAAGGGVRRLTNNYLPDFGPSWSPNGRFIAFTSIRTGLSQIYRMRADGSGQRRLTNAFGNCDSPAWSPRGTLIAFHCAMANEKVLVMLPDGTHIRTLLRRSSTIDGNPSWSPDGSLIAFSRGLRVPSWRGLGTWTIRPDGRRLRHITAVGGDPTFSARRSVARLHPALQRKPGALEGAHERPRAHPAHEHLRHHRSGTGVAARTIGRRRKRGGAGRV
jgi:Tol biopolymer transport system component